MRYSLLYNTSLRLFIISATLEEDECSYRRFFKCIDDNLKYPINIDNINNINLKNNRLFMDGRIHISPPGEVTRFEIKEYYETSEPLSVKEATNTGISKALEIIKSTDNGEILLFSYSTKECINICNQLNKNTNNNIVALPFFASMNKKYKNYIENLDKFKDKINFNKDIIVDIYANIIDDVNIATNNTYTRIIIVATNAAEASITIYKLKYVVDIGYQINVIYNPVNSSSDVNIEKITESSRIQRKGRVGRSESGTVYYIYTKGSREDIKSEYDMCNSDLVDTIYNILYDNHKELPLFYNLNFYKDYHYLNNVDNLKKILDTYQYLPEFELFKKQFTYIDNDEGIRKIFKIKDKYINIYNKLQKEYNNINIYNSGFDITNIIDNYGNFYIIHPDENKIKRDIRTGNIIKGGINVNLYDINKINIYIKNLTFKNLIVDLNFNESRKSKLKSNNKIAKTKISKLLQDISKYFGILEYNTDFAILIIYSILYDCSEDIIRIISALLLNKAKFKLSLLYEKKGKKINLKFKKLYENNKGDIFVILDIFNNFFNTFPFITDDNSIYGNSTDIDKYKYNYEIFKLLNESEKKDIELDIDSYNKFIKHQRELNLNTEETKEIFEISKKNSKFKDIEDSDKFDKWCKYYYLNKETIKNMINNYLKLKENYTTLYFIEKDNEYNFFSKLEQLLYVKKSVDKSDNILKCMLWGYRQNLVEYKGYKYYNILKDTSYTNTELISNIPETTLIHSQYLLYINNINESNISLLINIQDIKFIFEIAFNIFNLKTYVKSNNNFINNYNTKFLNNNLSFIKKHQNISMIENFNNDIYINLLREIELLDKQINIDNIETSMLTEEIYKKRYNILNIIDFYYYYIKELIN